MSDTPPKVQISGRRTLLDYVFLSRPVLMPPVWTIALLGVASMPASPHPAWEWAIFIVQLWCLFGAVYILNQICDVESDRLNRKLFFLPESIITIRAAWVLTISLNVAALILGGLLGSEYLALTASIIGLGVVYSVGRSPWKNRPLLGFLANSVAHGMIVFLMGAAYAGVHVSDAWSTATAYGCAVGAVYLATTVADIPGDAAARKRTIAVWLGGRLTMLIAVLLVCAALIIALWQDHLVLAVASALSLPVFAWAVQSGYDHRAPKAAKMGIATLTLGAAIYFPVYLILAAVGFLVTRVFFYWRFGITYPTFE